MLNPFLPTFNPATLGLNLGMTLGQYLGLNGLPTTQEKAQELGLAIVKGSGAQAAATAAQAAVTGTAQAVKGAGQAIGNAATAVGKGVSSFLTQVIIILILALIGFAVINATIQKSAIT